jgi:hypothetical protein
MTGRLPHAATGYMPRLGLSGIGSKTVTSSSSKGDSLAVVCRGSKQPWLLACTLWHTTLVGAHMHLTHGAWGF